MATEANLLRLKQGFSEFLYPFVDKLLPIVAQFEKKPPYEGEPLELFIKTATEDAAIGYIFLRLVTNYWEITNPMSKDEINSLFGTMGSVDSPMALLRTISDCLFSLDFDEKDGYRSQEGISRALVGASEIVRRVVQPSAPNSITGSIELESELGLVHLNHVF